MMFLQIDPEKNLVRLASGAAAGAQKGGLEHRFRRRWEAWFLWCLLKAERENAALYLPTLQSVLALQGQATPLNRTQVLRLLASLQGWLDEINQGEAHPLLKLVFSPRKSSAGPWRLIVAPALQIEAVGHPLPGPAARITDSLAEQPFCLTLGSSVDGLFDALNQLLIADGFAAIGKVDQAIEVLSEMVDRVGLTANGQALCRLRLSGWHRRRGRFEVARRLAQAVQDDDRLSDPALKRFAHFQHHRIGYDENASAAWPHLLMETAQGPALPWSKASGQADGSADAQDRVLLAEWHILRALLGRRQLLAEHAAVGSEAGSDLERRASLSAMHQQCLQHTQAAAYLYAWLCHWDRLQAVVANWAFHLQAVFERLPFLDVSAEQVLRWHRLTLAYEDKLFAGRDTAWEYIFFAQFWLDHQHLIRDANATDSMSYMVDDLSPGEARFYDAALARQRECADERQLAIGLTQYLRFAKDHLPAEERLPTQQRLWRELSALLKQSPNGMLRVRLTQEGYARHWPRDEDLGL